MGEFENHISNYLKYLEKEGWSELICHRWKDQVYSELIQRFPNMSDEEWKCIEKDVFI